MGTGLLKVGAVSTEKRVMSSEASGTVWIMRNNQSFERSCGGGRSGELCIWVSLSVRSGRESDQKAGMNVGRVEEQGVMEV
jgi:hypothetical protein